MIRSVRVKGLTLLAALLCGVTSSTIALGQPVPPEVSLKHMAVSGKASSVEQSIAAILLKCDKCDASTKSALNEAKREIANLKQLLNELRDITNAKFVGIVKACQ